MKKTKNPRKIKIIKGVRYYLNDNGHGGRYGRRSSGGSGNGRPYRHQEVKHIAGGRAGDRTVDHKNKRHGDNRAKNLEVVSNRENVRREHKRNGDKVKK